MFRFKHILFTVYTFKCYEIWAIYTHYYKLYYTCYSHVSRGSRPTVTNIRPCTQYQYEYCCICKKSYIISTNKLWMQTMNVYLRLQQNDHCWSLFVWSVLSKIKHVYLLWVWEYWINTATAILVILETFNGRLGYWQGCIHYGDFPLIVTLHQFCQPNSQNVTVSVQLFNNFF